MGLPGAPCDAAMTAVDEIRAAVHAASAPRRLESVEKFFPAAVLGARMRSCNAKIAAWICFRLLKNLRA
jgi:hypothetical protein